jgi:hypothetical protein
MNQWKQHLYLVKKYKNVTLGFYARNIVFALAIVRMI